MVTSILRLPNVKAATGLPRSTIYLHISQGLFPKQITLGSAYAVGWPANEVAAVNAARIAGKSNDEIRELVVELEAARKAGRCNDV